MSSVSRNFNAAFKTDPTIFHKIISSHFLMAADTHFPIGRFDHSIFII